MGKDDGVVRVGGGKRKVRSIRLDVAMDGRLQGLASELGVPVTQIVGMCLCKAFPEVERELRGLVEKGIVTRG